MIEFVIISMIAGLLYAINYPDTKRAKRKRTKGYLWNDVNGRRIYK